ncbi:GPATCH11 [Cordylochernes scorpioides]|uniref:G patch domain-containing protein 11 n=1 Tax=Cordylochernes scorpioides TaxID=51811 RepID=A0ABY6JWU2_9ARAC|nr:GPATCH11 [Cordylochernes scorpioides]
MSSDSEDDYMSEAFLNPTNDIRPGLVFSNATKRKFELEKKAKELSKKPKLMGKKLEEHNRKEGLGNAIGKDNKGFKLLEKMGFKQGMTLGKSSASTAIKEPIAVVLKSDRSGLGKATEAKEKLEKFREIRTQKEDLKQKLQDNFRQRMRSKLSEKQLKGDLYASQKICQQFDNEGEIEEPKEIWYWPPVKKSDEDENEEDEEEEVLEEEIEEIDDYSKLELLTKYLRETYFYCIWCGTKFEDTDDLAANCEGNTREDHDLNDEKEQTLDSPQFQPYPNRESGTSIFSFFGATTLVSYVPKKRKKEIGNQIDKKGERCKARGGYSPATVLILPVLATSFPVDLTKFGSTFGFSKNKKLVSYVPKIGQFVTLLSTMHSTTAIDQETAEQQKPEIITFYNMTKGGVDVVDQKCILLEEEPKDGPCVYFFNFLDGLQ